MRKFYFLSVFAFLTSWAQAQTGTYLYDPTSVCIDGAQQSLGNVTFGTSTFNQGCQISAVDVDIWWAKTDGNCPSDWGSGCSFHNETYFSLTTPGFVQPLAVAGTWSGCASSPNSVTTTFSTSAGTPPSGTPVSGTFSASGGNMANMIGTSALGAWNLIAGDNAGGDPLLVGAYRLRVTTIPDIINPTLTVPSSFSVNNTTGLCGANPTYSVSHYDLCGSSVVRLAGPASGAFFPLGSTTVTHRATDTYGRQTTESFTITVVDVQPPTISCPSNIVTVAGSGACSANVSYASPTHSDLCTATTLTLQSGPVSGGSFAVGTTTVTYRATDAAGNNANCSFTVTVNDTQNPQITCPGNSSVNATTGLCSATATYSIPAATDNCPGVTVARTAGPASGGTFNVGTTTVTHRATDASGNQASCSFTITVVDNQPPAISCPANITVGNTANQCSAAVSWTAPVGTDNCPSPVTVRTVGPAPGSTFTAQTTTTITYQVTDASGNQTSCSFTVRVNDTQLPSITCPSNISVNNDVGFCSAVVSYATPTFTDNCPGVTIQQTAGLPSTSQFGVNSSPNTVTFRATDAAGNQASCSFTITVTDTQAPAITCPSNISVNNAPGACNAVVSWTPPVGVDNCPGQTTVRTAGPAPGTTFNVGGSTTITYTSTDAVNQSTSCSFTVTVVDNTVPSVTCPANQNITFPNCQYTLPNYVGQGLATYSDNCAPLTVTQTPAPATVITQTTSVQVSVVDPSGNESICAFTVSPLDNTPPTFNSCPTAAVQVPVNSSCQFFMPDYSTMAVSDVCNPTLTLTQSPGAGTPQSAATSVTVTVSDGTNSTNCTFGVQPQDVTPPSIICPADRVEPANASCQFVLPNYTGLPSVVVSDNCTASPVLSQPSAGNTITGSGTVVLQAQDASGNIGTCSFVVTVGDNTPPTVTCPSTQSVNFNANCSYTMGSFTSLATASDNCPGSVTLTQVPTAGTSIGSSSSTVTIVGTDVAGNQASCNFTVNVTDNTPPSLACPQTQQVNVNSNCTYTLGNFVGQASSTDNCSSVTLAQSPASGTVYNFTTDPSVTVTITSTDAASNQTQCTFQVLLNDVTAPSITCAADIPVLLNSSCQFVVGNRTNHYTALSDNCGGTPVVTQSPSSSTVIQGQAAITLTATDASGNSSSCQFNIVPSDSQVPTVTSCPQAPVSVTLGSNCSYTLADYTGLASFTDNCDQSLTITQTPGFGTVVNSQNNTVVTVRATDDAGNFNTCSITIAPVDNTAPSLVCPPNQVQNFNASCQFVLLDYRSMATVSDNCTSPVTVTQFQGAGQTISGTTSILLTATDAAGNSSQCTFSVIPNDNTPPTITCPAAQTVALNSSCLYNVVNVTGLATGISDNCDLAANVIVTQSITVGTAIGANFTMVLTATDGAGNASTCQFAVNPTDQTAPSISCPQNQTVNANSNCQYNLVSYTSQAIVSDFCDPSVQVTQSPAPANGLPIATVSTVQLTATDASGNSNSCSFTVTAIDNVAPTISCPTDTIVSTNSNCQYVMINETQNHELIIADNCDPNPVVTQTPSAGSILTSNTTVTLTVADASGNTSSCSYLYTVTDLVNPTIVCPADLVVSSNAQCAFVIPDFTSSGAASDNCDPYPNVTQNPPVGFSFVQDTLMTLTIVDAANNSSSCTFTITANDNNLPTITCPGNQLVSFDASCEYNLLDYTGLAVASDNCGAVTVTQDLAIGSLITESTIVELTATDGDLNAVSCTFSVIPSDASAPVVTCLQPSISVSSSAQCGFTLADYTSAAFASATDNCASSFTFTQSPVAGSLIGGSTVVTLSTTDAAGNVGSCTMTVNPVDNTAPVLFCPAGQTVSLNASCEFSVPNYTSLVFVSDNCDSGPFSISQSPVAGSIISGADLNVISFSVTDGGGNTGACSFNLVTQDNTPPTITCPASLTVSANSTCQFILSDYTTAATANDNCLLSSVAQSPVAGGTQSGTVTVTLTATDVAGNTNSCNFNVTMIDNMVPSITCPANQSPTFTSNCQFTVIDYTSMTSFSDNCDNTLFVSQSPGTGTIISGNTTVTITATDDAGNSNSCNFNIVPQDLTVPVITCPTNVVRPLSASCDFSIVSFASLVTATDNCTANPTIVQSPSTGLVSGPSLPITMTAIDGNGNSATCTFTLTLQDVTIPTLANCPANQTVPLSPTCQFIVPNYTGIPVPADNCDPSLTMTQSPLAGSLIGGATVVTITATDDFGNAGNCSFTVTPNDVTPPSVFNCSSNITVFNNPGICGAQVNYPTITSIDNCAGVIVPQLTTGQASGTIFPFGFTTVTYVATDGSGNATSCVFTVTVNDNENPIILCPSAISANVVAGTCGAPVTYALPSVTDNCTNPITPTLSGGLASGSTFPVGVTTVTYGADDLNGNTASCSFTVTVVDNEPPSITCPANISVNNNTGVCAATVSYSLPTVTDNCTNGIVPTLSSGQASGSTFAFGTTTNTFQAVDASGNSASCSFTVTVSDNENPVLTCPSNVSVSCDAVVSYNPPTVSDNCTSSIVPVQVSPNPGDPFVFGPNLVTFTATDASGNTGTCSFTVTIIDVAPPTIACPSAQTALFSTNCQLVLPNYTSLATTSDNCDSQPVVTQSPAAGASVAGPTATITLISTDFAGNSSNCTFVLRDTRPPVVNCPGNQLVGSNINCQFTLLNYTLLATSTDNCGQVALTQSPVAGTVINGTTTVSITSTDNLGNQSSCQFTVTLTDNIPPSITCIGNQQALFNSNCMYQLPNYTGQATSTDNCDTDLTITQSPLPGSMITGSSVITLTSTDDNGNATSCSFSVNPIDNIPPSISCPTSQIAELNATCQYQLASYVSMATTSDNCSSNITVTQSPAVGTTHSLNTIVTLTGNDGNGNSASCTFLVVPQDNIAPVIVCPADLQVSVNSNCEYLLTNYTGMGTSTDNCSTSFTVTQSPSVGTVITSSTAITLTVNDGNGNSSTCSFNVIPVDNMAPTISCGPNQAVAFNANCQYQLLDYTGSATTSDNCSSVISVTQSHASGSLISASTSITLTANDGNGNTSSCSFSVIPTDQMAPVITCPSDQNVSFNQNCAYVLPSFTSLGVASDNCSSVVPITQNLTVGTTINDTISVTLTATDGAGNSSACSFNVNPSDNSNPTIACPPNANVSLNSLCQFVIPDYKLVTTYSDNCGPTFIAQSPVQGSLISASTLVTMTVSDGNGNQVSCTFTVNPTDSQLPTIACPSNQNVVLSSACQFQLPSYTGLAVTNDNCTSTMTVNQFPPVGTFIVSSTAVTLSVQDASGNAANCSFTVIPHDQTDPVATQCPSNQVATLNSNCSFVIPNYSSMMQATDNCDASLTYQQQPLAGGSLTAVGTYPMQVGAVDDNGNFALCEFTLTLNDAANPIVSCPPNQLVGLNTNCQFEIPNYTGLATASDACGTVTLTQSPPAGSFIANLLNATIIATDASGNTATCTFFVDVIPMEVTVVGTDVTCDNGSNGTATVSVIGGTPPYSYNWGGFNPNALSPGAYEVIVTDANGCIKTGTVTIGNGPSFEIDVTPGGNVQICSGSSVVLNAGAGYAAYNWSTGASVQSITVSTPASYWVTVTNGQGCVSNTDTVIVSFYAPLIPDVTAGGDGVLYCTNDTSSSYQWYLNGAPISNANQYWYCPQQSGNFYVRIVDANGCTVNSSNEEFTYSPNSPCATGIQEHDLSLDIYPNPTNGIFNVSYVLQDQKDMEMAVFDLMGKQVTQEVRVNSNAGTTMFDLSGQADGVYTLRVIVGKDRVFQERLVLVK